MHDGTLYLNPQALRITGASPAYIEEEKAAQMKEAARRLSEYRGERGVPEISGRVVVIVDDGIATGATMLVATQVGQVPRRAGRRRRGPGRPSEHHRRAEAGGGPRHLPACSRALPSDRDVLRALRPGERRGGEGDPP